MGNQLYSDALLGKTVVEATEMIKANRVYLDDTTTHCRIMQLDIYEPDALHIADYRVDRLSIVVDKNDIITRIRGVG